MSAGVGGMYSNGCMCGQAVDWIVMSCNVKFKLTNGMQLNAVNGGDRQS